MQATSTIKTDAPPTTKVVAISFHEGAVGKHFSQTKRRYDWKLTLGDLEYDISFTYSSVSGKRCVLVNGKTQYEEKTFFGSNFTHSWSLDGHSLSIMPMWAVKEQIYRSFDLSVDGRPFEVLLNPGGTEDLKLPKLKIVIENARGLHENGNVDPYCTCEIPSAHGSMCKTSIASKTADPTWNHEHTIADYVPGESIHFVVMDKGTHTWTKTESCLGRGILQSEQFYPFGFDGVIRLSRSAGKALLKLKVSVSDTIEERRLRDIFDRCDQNGDGSLNKRELIKALRVDEDVAEFFHLPQQIRQEDGSRDAMERIFQEMDTNADREVSWDEFRSFFARRPESWCPPTPEPGAASPRSPKSMCPRRDTSPRQTAASPRQTPASPRQDASPRGDTSLPLADTGSHDAGSRGSGRKPSKSPKVPAADAGTAGLGFEPPKTTASRRKDSAASGASHKKGVSRKSPKLPTACAFADLADFGGFGSGPDSAHEESWGVSPKFGGTNGLRSAEEQKAPAAGAEWGFNQGSNSTGVPVTAAASPRLVPQVAFPSSTGGAAEEQRMQTGSQEWGFNHGFTSFNSNSSGTSPILSPPAPFLNNNGVAANIAISPRSSPLTPVAAFGSVSSPSERSPRVSSRATFGNAIPEPTSRPSPIDRSSRPSPLAAFVTPACEPGSRPSPMERNSAPPSVSFQDATCRLSPMEKNLAASSGFAFPSPSHASKPSSEAKAKNTNEEASILSPKVTFKNSESDPVNNFAEAEKSLLDGFSRESDFTEAWPDSPLLRNRPRARSSPALATEADVQNPTGRPNERAKASSEESVSAVVSPPIPPALSYSSTQQRPRPITRTLSPRSTRAMTEPANLVVDPWGNTYSPSAPPAAVVDPWGYSYAK